MKLNVQKLLTLGIFFLASSLFAMNSQQGSLQSKIEACKNCAAACENCIANCLEQTDQNSRCLKLDRDCADICTLNAKMMERGSEFSDQISALCSQVCQACGDECAKNPEDQDCKRCSEACYRCVEEC